LLPELLAPRLDQSLQPPSLLVVGDVDYGAAPGQIVERAVSRSAPKVQRGAALPHFAKLDATRPEILAIKDSFQRRFKSARVTELRAEEATEGRMRDEAPQHRYLHLATHGFFAPPELRSALSPDPKRDPFGARDVFSVQGVSGYHPGLLSGLVLAGANLPPQPDADDGILTALEVAELDLHRTELVVLSACETGLGKVAGGEGVLGLQRAFQVAGARSVVASLWKIDDEATRQLMERFYENLWQKRMGKLEALRQAQLWMLHQGRVRGAGGKRPVDAKNLDAAQPPGKRTPPYFWAGFVLSGDWR
jgi:CHAT domain-containing protein